MSNKPVELAVISMNLLHSMGFSTDFKKFEAAYDKEGYDYLNFLKWVTKVAEPIWIYKDFHRNNVECISWEYSATFQTGLEIHAYVVGTGKLPPLTLVYEWAGDYIQKYYEEDFHDNYRTPTD